MAEQNLASLAAYLAAGWVAEGDFGYYIHRNRVYLQGEVYNARAGENPIVSAAATSTVLTGLPAGIRPAVDTALTLLADLGQSDDPATPGVTLPSTIDATITAAGDVVLASVPAYANATPASPPYEHLISTPDFTTPLFFTLILGNTNWQAGAALADDYTPVSLAAYLSGGDFDDVDSTIAVHDARVHLGGRVRARTTNAQTLTPSLPSQYRDGIGGDGSMTTAAGPAFRVGVQVLDSGFTQIIRDFGDAAASPAWYWSASGTTQPFVGLNHHGSGGGGQGALRRTTDVAPPADVTWDNGIYEDCGLDILGNPIQCPLAGSTPTVTITFADLLASYYPEPDWIVAGFVVGGATRIFKATTGCGPGTNPYAGCGAVIEPGDASVAADVGCTFVDALTGTPVPNAASVYPDATNTIANWASGATGGSDFPWPSDIGVLAAKATSEYAGNPSNFASSLLWRPGEINSVTLTIAGSSHTGTIAMWPVLYPYWERRGKVIHAGDVIDLAGAGWQALYTPPAPVIIPPGVMVAGAHQAGIVAN